MKRHLFNIIFSFLCISVWGQNQDEPIDNSVQILARPMQDKVLLRWAPSNPSVWLKANQHGYVIERYTIYRDNVRLETPEKTRLTNTAIKPAPFDTWEQIVNDNDYAAIIAQSLFGESFVVEGADNEGGLLQILNKAEEIDQRFSFALYAADMNFEAAKKAGLGFEDITIKNNERYFYKIEAIIPEEIVKVKEGSVFVDMQSIEDLPPPIDLLAIGDDKTIMLTWEYEMFRSIYTSYFVERSEDGQLFKRLGDIPLVNLNDKEDKPAKRMYYVDTIAQNNKKYHYRVVGVSPFSEESKPSEVVSASGTKKLEFTAFIETHKLDNENGVLLKWEFPEEGESQIQEFQLNWAPDAKGPYSIVKTGIAPNTRETTHENLEPSNYFTLTAIGENNQQTTSFPVFIQAFDETPPIAPIQLEATIDSLGVVKVTWAENTESDLLGYRVFRANLENEEYSQLTKDPLEINTYTDTVQLKSLNSKVYYKIVAVDIRFNLSDYSEALIVKKPDIVPPSSPIFTSYSIENGTAILNWENSTSDDVATHKLFRQKISENEGSWDLIYETANTNTYTDNTTVGNEKYRYAIFAIDEAGLLSAPSTPITLTIKNFKAQEYIKGLLATPDRTNMLINLSWKKPAEEVAEILVYKSKTDGKPILFKQISASINKLADTKVFPNNTYIYHIKPILKQGGIAAVKVVEVKY